MVKTLLTAPVAAFMGIFSQTGFSNTINLGAVMVAFLIIIVAGFFTLRDKVTKAQIEGWRGNYEAEKEARELVQQKLDESVGQVREALEVVGNQKAVIERLEALPNLERVIKLMSDTSERQAQRSKEIVTELISDVADLIDVHEREAIERHVEIMKELRHDTIKGGD